MKFITLLLTFFFLLMVFYNVLAQHDQLYLGTRPLSMGEAFLAIADDGNAIYWNPAGLATMERIQTSFSYANLYGMGIHSYYFSFLSRLYFIPPLTDYLAFGVDWSTIKLADDDELDFGRNEFHFALGIQPPNDIRYFKDFSFGISATYLTMAAQAYGISETAVDANGFGWNFGMLYYVDRLKFLPGKLKLGFMIHDIGGTWIKHQDTGINEKVLNQNIRWGLSYRPFEEFPGDKIPISDPVFAIDIDDRFHFGLEFWLAHTFAFRAGIQKDLHTKEKPTLSFGLGFKMNMKDLPGASIDYALTDSPVLPNSNKQFGGSLIFKENPRLIRIEGAHINDVYASLYRHYGLPGSNIGTMKLKNVHDDTLKVWIAFEKNRYMESQLPDTMLIAPGTTVDFPLRVIFKSDIFDAPAGRFTGEVKACYEHKKTKHAAPATIDFSLYGKNYLNWDDPGKAAAFVTTDHPLVQKFVTEALKKTDGIDPAQWSSRYRLTNALLIFNALKACGFDYRLDEVTPFPSLADTLRGARYRRDKIHYPAKFLSGEDRFGDCDDFTVLYASLLQQAGLATAFISGSGHIFLMFDTSIPESDTVRLPVAPDLFVKRNGTLWIPVETTLIPSASFAEAWTAGADTMNGDPQRKQWKAYDVAQYQAKYPAVSPELIPPQTSAFQAPDFSAHLRHDIIALNDLKEQYYQTFEVSSKNESLTLKEKVKLLNRYGILLGQNGEPDRSRVQFQKIIGLKPGDTFSIASAWNNLGNIEFILGNYNNAESAYINSLKLNEYSRGTYLNLAMLYQMMYDSTAKNSIYQRESEKVLLKAAQLLEGNSVTAYALFSFEERTEVDGKAKGLFDKLANRIKKVKDYVDKSFTKYLQQKEVTGIALDKYGTKGRGEIDPDWGLLLFWSYE